MNDQTIQYNKAQERNNKNWHCIRSIDSKERLHYNDIIDCSTPNNGGLVSHCYESLYTLGTDVDRRREMDKGREENNEHRESFPY